MREASFLLVGEQPYAERMVESIKDVHGIPVVQMTDLKTKPVKGVDKVVRLPFRVPLMLYRLKHLATYRHTEMLIVDTDVIAKRPVDDVWDIDFDVALTLRGPGELMTGDGLDISIEMPFNTGVMFSRGNAFWRDCYTWLAGGTPEEQRWYGDQLAVANVVRRETHEVLALLCSEFNWAPSSRTDTSEARFWHYKGATRKKWITSDYGQNRSGHEGQRKVSGGEAPGAAVSQDRGQPTV